MNLGDIQVRVKNQFGDTAGAVVTDEDIARWVTDAQLDFFRKTKFGETNTTTASVLGQRAYTVSEVLEVRRVKYDGYPLRFITIGELDDRFPARLTSGYGNDTPRYWRPTETGIEVFPAPPDNLGTISIDYIPRPADVTSIAPDLTVPETYHEDIVRRVLERTYETDGQWNAADRMRADYKERTNEAAHDKATGGADSYPAIRVLPGDGGDYY